MFETSEQERRVRRSGVYLLRRRTRRMDAGKFKEMAARLDLGRECRVVETEEALAASDGQRALVYAQPGSKLAGVLFYTDQTRGVAAEVERCADSKHADRWANDFLRSHELLAEEPRDERVRASFELSASETAAVVFDGKERRRVPMKTDVTSRVHLNGIRVMGPRAKVRMVFKDGETPIMMHCGLWESLEVHEERDLVSADEVTGMLRTKLSERRGGRATGGRSANRLLEVNLAYIADEYNGGPDLLLPYYCVVVEQRDERREERKLRRAAATQGPRQVFRIPAFR